MLLLLSYPPTPAPAPATPSPFSSYSCSLLLRAVLYLAQGCWDECCSDTECWELVRWVVAEEAGGEEGEGGAGCESEKRRSNSKIETSPERTSLCCTSTVSSRPSSSCLVSRLRTLGRPVGRVSDNLPLSYFYFS